MIDVGLLGALTEQYVVQETVAQGKYTPNIAYRTSAAGYREQEWMCNVPLWACSRVIVKGDVLSKGRR